MAQQPMADAVSGDVAQSAEYNKLIDNIQDLDARLGPVVSTATAASRLTTLETRTTDASTGNAALGTRVTTLETNYVPKTRTVSAGTGLTGGGDLSANRSLAVSFGTAAGTVAQGNDSRITITQDATKGNNALNTRVTALESASGTAVPLIYTGTWGNGTSDVSLGAGPFGTMANYSTVYSVAIPDPGYTYNLRVNAGFPVSFGGSSGRFGYVAICVGSATATPVQQFDVGFMPESWTAFQIPSVVDLTDRTGATTVYIRAMSQTTGSFARAATGRIWCQVEVIRG